MAIFKGKSQPTVSENTTTIIGEGIRLSNAAMTGEGTIRIDGNFVGTITINGDVILGEPGTIEGDLCINNALIAGKLIGNVHALSTIHLASTCRVKGNIETRNLIIDEGAAFNGECNMTKEGNASLVTPVTPITPVTSVTPVKDDELVHTE